MSTIAKENEVLTATPEAPASRAATPSRSDEHTGRLQPVALEVPVSVNGARTVEGSDKREPFSESTKTVLIFGNGAVIRLTSVVAVGQLLFLTNDKTRKEVVCQVVKSKNYRNVSGYVELEFTEPVVGFWGMRFPSDKIGSPVPAASGVPKPAAMASASIKPVVPVAPVAPKNAPTVSATPPKLSDLKPVVATSVALPPTPALSTAPPAPIHVPEIKPAEPKTRQAISPLVSEQLSPSPVKQRDAMASLPAPTPAQAISVPSQPHTTERGPSVNSLPPTVVPVSKALDSTSLPQVAEIQVHAPAEFQVQPPAPVENSAEALRQQNSRLQEQLSSRLFADASAAKEVPVSAPVLPVDTVALAETTVKLFEFASATAVPPVVRSAPGAADPLPVVVEPAEIPSELPQAHVSAASHTGSLLDFDEDIKIPAWLEPLARNATAPLSTQELIEREKAKHVAALTAKHDFEDLFADPLPAPVVDAPQDLQVSTFGSELPVDQPQFSNEISSPGAKLPRWLGLIAAALLLGAGGYWYFNQRTTGLRPALAATATPASTADAASKSPNATTQLPPATKSSALPATSNATSNTTANASPTPTLRNQPVPSGSSSSPSLLNANARVDVTHDAAELTNSDPQPKKPSLGAVSLASPTVNRRGDSQNANVAEPTIDESIENSSSADPGAGILAGNSKQPVAPSVPLPVGGDVKPAKLISSVPPIYSPLAKSQHISGDIRIDALIDATGHVTTMKVVAGPTLLHQSAMDALRQWKYQPARLDGKPVPMHLTVTIQFRLK